MKIGICWIASKASVNQTQFKHDFKISSNRSHSTFHKMILACTGIAAYQEFISCHLMYLCEEPRQSVLVSSRFKAQAYMPDTYDAKITLYSSQSLNIFTGKDKSETATVNLLSLNIKRNQFRWIQMIVALMSHLKFNITSAAWHITNTF